MKSLMLDIVKDLRWRKGQKRKRKAMFLFIRFILYILLEYSIHKSDSQKKSLRFLHHKTSGF